MDDESKSSKCSLMVLFLLLGMRTWLLDFEAVGCGDNRDRGHPLTAIFLIADRTSVR